MGTTTPRQRVTAAVTQHGERQFVARCTRLLDGEIDADVVQELGGDSAVYVLGGHEGGPDGYWPRTWALRALLYAWDADAARAVLAACTDEHWRVREMAAKVIAARMPPSDNVRAALGRLAADDNKRVRAAAERALQKLG